MKISLLGWEAQGFRCPDVSIDLRKDSTQRPHHVSLIQMPNGTGKTTTLKLLEAALTGSAASWKQPQLQSLRRPSESNGRGVFVCRLSLDNSLLTIELEVLFDEGVVHYATTFGSKNVPEWAPPPESRMFLKQEFVKLFAFDGEYAGNLLTPGNGDADAAIEALFQLYLLSDVAEAANDDWKYRSRQAAKCTSTGLAERQEEAIRLEDRLKDVLSTRAKLEDSLRDLREKLCELEERAGERVSSADENRKKLEASVSSLNAAEQDLAEGARNSMEALAEPHRAIPALGRSLGSLVDNLGRLKLPEETSREWFVELASEENMECVCGRPLGPHERKAILDRSGGYLDSSISGVINEIKSSVSACARHNSTAMSFTASLDQLRSGISACKVAETQRDALRNEQIRAGDSALAAIVEEITLTRTLIKKNEGLMERIDGRHDPSVKGPIFSSSYLKAELSRQNAAIAEATETLSIRNATVVIRDILQDAKSSAIIELRRSIRDDCNERLKAILKSDPLQIASIDPHLSLAGQGGASMGQTLAVGYTFLATLLKRGEHSFPLIVDSPAGPLDRTVREQIGEIVPGLCDQFVALTISTEREGFVDAIDARYGDDVQFLTHYRRSESTIHLQQEIPQEAAVETHNGVLVNDRSYFLSFDFGEGDE